MEGEEVKKTDREESTPPRKKYIKPDMQTVQFSEKRALACLKTVDDGQIGCMDGFYS